MGVARSATAEGLASGADGVEEIMRAGGEELRLRMSRTERHLQKVTAGAGAPLASYASATVRAGGKRLRPLLVLLACESAGGPPRTPGGEQRLGRGAGAGGARAPAAARDRR